MLTGKRAFEGSSPASVIAGILEREPVPLHNASPLDRVVRRCLAKEPDQRFQTARDLKTALFWAMEQPSGTRTATSSRRRWIRGAAALILATIAGWAVLHFREPSADARVFRVQINPPEDGRFIFGFTTGGIALSPDGRTAAFVASGGGRTGLWVQRLDASSARLLVTAASVAFPFWSSDGKSIGFFAGRKLQRVDLAGGAPFTVCDVAAAPRGATWSSDGRIIFATTPSTGLLQVPASGGAPLMLTSVDVSHGEGLHMWPQVLPGGRFLYWVRANKPENTGIYASSFAKPGERVHLLNSDTNALYAPGNDGKHYLFWLRGGTLLTQEFNINTLKLVGEPYPIADPVAQAGMTGPVMKAAISPVGEILYSAANTSGQFTWFDRSGKRLEVVGERGEYGTFRLSPDGRRIVVARATRGGSDLWLLNVERGVPIRVTDAGRQFHSWPIWSPDGRTIAFLSSMSFSDLSFKDAALGGSEQALLEFPTPRLPHDWSLDGRFILYTDVAPGTGYDLWMLPLTRQGKPAMDVTARPYLRTSFSEIYGRFAPEKNPRWVAYQSDESGRFEVYVDTFPEPRHKIPISSGGGSYPAWGAGGSELYYVSPDFKLMAVSVKLGNDTMEPSAPRELFRLPIANSDFSPFEPAPDGKRFLIRATPQQAVPEPLILIVNWTALLKRGTAEP
jgi:Tol biopolymer transport system component